MANLSDKVDMPNSDIPDSDTPELAASIDLCVEDDNWTAVQGLEKSITNAVRAALSQCDASTRPISLTIVLDNNQRIEALNANWRDKPKPTNILSFPAPENSTSDAGETYIGDLILAYDVIFDEANEQRKPLATHLCHLIIHGVLHLLGFDHQNDEEAFVMEQLEIKAMVGLGLSDPYQMNS